MEFLFSLFLKNASKRSNKSRWENVGAMFLNCFCGLSAQQVPHPRCRGGNANGATSHHCFTTGGVWSPRPTWRTKIHATKSMEKRVENPQPMTPGCWNHRICSFYSTIATVSICPMPTFLGQAYSIWKRHEDAPRKHGVGISSFMC